MRLILLAAALASVLSATTARADCAAEGETCQLACQSRLGGADQDAARAGCVARCVTDRAACVAQSAIDDAARTANRDLLPWLDRQTDRMRSMFDEYLRRTPNASNESKSKGQQL